MLIRRDIEELEPMLRRGASLERAVAVAADALATEEAQLTEAVEIARPDGRS